MNTKTKHTAVQWASQPTAGHDRHGQSAVYDVQTGRTIALVYDGAMHAAYIVQACNAHAGLVEALRRAIPWLEDADRKGNQQLEKLWSDLADARKALQNAGITL